MRKGGTLKGERFNLVREGLGDAGVDDIAFPALEMMERNSDEAGVAWKVGRASWFVSRLVKKRGGEIP
jgi:hypothetical protein